MPQKRDDYSATELQKQRNSRQPYSTATDAGMASLLERARAKRQKPAPPPSEPTSPIEQPAPPPAPKGRK